VDEKITVVLSALNDGFVLSNPGALNRSGSAPGGAHDPDLVMRVLGFDRQVTCTATNFPSGPRRADGLDLVPPYFERPLRCGRLRRAAGHRARGDEERDANQGDAQTAMNGSIMRCP
jgi:hypothetical protein